MRPCPCRRRAKRSSIIARVSPSVSEDDRAQVRDKSMLFPMYVVNVSEFILMRLAQPHEAWKVAGKLRRYAPDDPRVAVFVSHQWCARNHPDPDFAQLGVLQGAFKRVAAGRLKIDEDIRGVLLHKSSSTSVLTDRLHSVMSWCMWYDYFSVPQEEAGQLDLGPGHITELGKAIASLQFYVAACEHFFVLAPCVQHEDGNWMDYNTWRERGWCRFERLSRAMLCDDQRVLLLRQRTAAIYIGIQDYIFEPVCAGEFTSESDKLWLAPAVHDLLESKLELLTQLARRQESLHLMALATPLLAGLPVSGMRLGKALERDFLERLGLLSPTRTLLGTTPLLLASRAGEVQAMRAMLLARACVDCVERRKLPAMAVVAGDRPIHVAAALGHQAAVALLLRARAEANSRRPRARATPLHVAGTAGAPGVIAELLRHRAEINARDAVGQTPLHVCCAYGRLEGVLALLSARAEVEGGADGLSPLHIAGLFGSGVPIVRSLLLARASMDSRYSPRAGSPVWLLFSLLSLSYTLGFRSYLRSIAHNIWGSTPLMVAVMAGSREEAQLMLGWGGDLDAANTRGRSSRMLVSESLDEAFAAELT